MASRFIATSVSIPSADGFESTEVAIESEEAKRVRLAQERAAARPLYDQLQEHQRKKQVGSTAS
jgi:hypothetical protein